jgi:hypothetical protein
MCRRVQTVKKRFEQVARYPALMKKFRQVTIALVEVDTMLTQTPTKERHH